MGILGKIFGKKKELNNNWRVVDASEIKTNLRLRNAVENHGWEVVHHVSREDSLMGDMYYVYRPGSKTGAGTEGWEWYADSFGSTDLDDMDMDDMGMPEFHKTKNNEILSTINKINKRMRNL